MALLPRLRWILVPAFAALLGSCTYVQHAARQNAYAEEQKRAPSLSNLKHILDTETFYVYGRILDPGGLHPGAPVAVAAYADAYGKTELVDVMHNARVGTHYGLNLPRMKEMTFSLVVLLDSDHNGTFDPGEVVAARRIASTASSSESRVLGNVDIEIAAASSASIPEPLPVRRARAVQKSLFYPGESLRTLDDPIFDAEMATLGMYEPAAFTEQAPTMFYALEEELGYKIPVIFVHGIGGSAREFEPLVERLDRGRFKAWFFHYPSGAPLDQMGQLFYRIFLSGDAVERNPMIPMAIVAHSMGGLVVREALNLVPPPADELASKGAPSLLFISIASPLGGHPAAASGEESGPLVVPSWRSLNPASAFIANLYRTPRPVSTDYHLFFTYQNDGLIRTGENSDGVVPLSSQLRPEAQAEATMQHGFNATHVGVLHDQEALDFIVRDIHRLQTQYPPDHMAWFMKGGFVVPDGWNHGPVMKYHIETIGQYLLALARGQITPVSPDEQHFVDVVKGRTTPAYDMERAWLDFIKTNPAPTPKSSP